MDHVDFLSQKTSQRLEELDHEIKLVNFIDGAIAKTTFHFRSRKFVESIIKQRQLIIDRHIGWKNDYKMLKLIDHLKVNLDAAGKNDRAMARYFLLNEEDIRKLIPGSYPNKRFSDFISLRDQARDINNRQAI